MPPRRGPHRGRDRAGLRGRGHDIRGHVSGHRHRRLRAQVRDDDEDLGELLQFILFVYLNMFCYKYNVSITFKV